MRGHGAAALPLELAAGGARIEWTAQGAVGDFSLTVVDARGRIAAASSGPVRGAGEGRLQIPQAGFYTLRVAGDAAWTLGVVRADGVGAGGLGNEALAGAAKGEAAGHAGSSSHGENGLADVEVVLDSQPRGATVWSGTHRLGKTPVRFVVRGRDRKESAFDVEFELDDYLTQKLTVDLDRNPQVMARLEPDPAAGTPSTGR